MELEHKHALITGSTSGIGAETAKLFAREGAHVIVSGRDGTRGMHVVQTIVHAGGIARFIHADLADMNSLRQLAETAGALDILVNNAASFPAGATLEQDEASFDLAMDVNIRAPFFLTAALAPKMIARGAASIVNVSTMAASIAIPGLSVYSATKAAPRSLARTLGN